MKRLLAILIVPMLFATIMCTQSTVSAVKKGITAKPFGIADGKKVLLYTLTNSKGDALTITNYGGHIISWVSPDKYGNRTSIIVGMKTLAEYQVPEEPYFGGLIGRCCNRIAKGKFKIGNTEYTLATNNGKNHLHGGIKGFDKVVWEPGIINDTTAALTLYYISADGEEGYPGNLKVKVCYTFTDANELQIEYTATTDKPTPVALTNHSYFNLTGSILNTIYNHALQINADKYTPVDETLIPTSEIKDVKGTPFDFTTPQKIGSRIGDVSGGYDHNFVLNKQDKPMPLVAVLTDSLSGRRLEVYTQEPGLQFYSGNFLDGTFKTPGGEPIRQHTALCLETQHFPDSPNEPAFPSVILQPGTTYHTITKYKLSIDN